MNIKRAIDHFRWKFQNIWKPTENDVEAINEIMKFVNEKHSKQLENNELFCKLYIKYYGELLKYYRASVFDKEPQKELHKLLDTPLENIIQEFTDTVNEIETFLKMEVAGITEGHKHCKSDKQLKSEKESFKVEMLEPELTFEQARDNLNSMINLALNRY